MTAALQLRRDMAIRVATGTENPAAALTRLRTQASPSGLGIDSDADFAFAAMDVGHRLAAANKPAEAESFFRETEKSLTTMIQKTPDNAARDKAQYLSARANIRARYLSEAVAAKTDIDEAIRLRPDDAYLKQLRVVLASERAEFFKATPRS
jgi:hypothetical protein